MTGRRFDESHVLALAALFGPLLALYSALGMAPLFTVVAVAALVLARSRRPWLRVAKPAAVALAVIVAWAAASMIWTIEPHMGLYTVPRMAGLAFGGLSLVVVAGDLDEAGQRRLRLALAAGVTMALVMAAIEIFWRGPGGMVFYTRNPWFDSYIPRLGRGLTVAAALLVPAMVAAWRCGFRLWSGVILVLAVLTFVAGHTLSAKLALVVMPVVFLVTWKWPRLGGGAVSAAMAAVILAFPLLALAPSPQETSDAFPFLPNSSHHRLTIWTFTASKVMEHPLLGWGIEASRSIPNGEDIVVVFRPDLRRGGREHVDEQLMPLHPHNGPGQIWLELGGVGALLVCGLMVVLGRIIATAPTRIDAAMTASLTASAFIVACVSYGVWQSWWLGSLGLSAALCTAVSTRRTDAAETKMLSGGLS